MVQGNANVKAQPASTVPTPPTQTSLQDQANALMAQIEADNNQVNLLSEQYDQALVNVSLEQKAVSQTQAKLLKSQDLYQQTQNTLREAALNDYFVSSPLDQVSEMMTTAVQEAQIKQMYAQSASESLSNALNNYKQAQVALQFALVAHQSALTKAQSDAALLSSKKTAVEQASQNAQNTLGEVKGQLAQAIAQAAAQAAQAAAAAAAAATSEQAKAQAEKKAIQVVNVLSAITTQSPNTTTNKSLNQIEASALGTTQLIIQNGGTVDSNTAQPSGTSTITYPPPPVADRLTEATPAQGLDAVTQAEGYLGVPYVWGGASMQGVDCSGLVLQAWAPEGIDLLHSAYYQYNQSTPVSLQDLQPGDLLFYNFSLDGSPYEIDHVVMYVGSGPYGKDTIIQASEPGTNVSYAPLYLFGFIAAGRP
ncbi:MAG: hypothetical protein HKL80_06540 [Acidimicrobiales bacterium]|nr:hypothetical protein [Acidimicrobiales bacterium]